MVTFYFTIIVLMHQTRKTHNAHNETQRRFRKNAKVAYWRVAPVHKEHGENGFYVDYSGSRKFFKKICNKTFRKKKDFKELKTSNGKVLDCVADKWDYLG